MKVDVVVAFFLLGMIARGVKANFEFPPALYQAVIIFLLLAIGLKGGIALNTYNGDGLLIQSLAVIAIGLVLPLIAFPVLYNIGDLPRDDAASIAAHYGSVSVGTYAVAIAFLDARGIVFEAYFPLFVALLEVPAIAVGIWLARNHGKHVDVRNILHEVFFNQGVLLLVGGLLIGWWAGAEQTKHIMPFFKDLFHGVLALFLLNMGLVAADKLGSMKQYGSFVASFAVVMPLVGALLGAIVGQMIGLSIGGVIMLATLAASASYIAVPAAMAVAVPGANQSLSMAASLAVTFPFNVLVGIPLYTSVIPTIID